MANLRPIRKVAAAIGGGLPIAALLPYLASLVGIDLPEPVAGLIGAAVTALIAYLVKSAPGEPVAVSSRHVVID